MKKNIEKTTNQTETKRDHSITAYIFMPNKDKEKTNDILEDRKRRKTITVTQ